MRPLRLTFSGIRSYPGTCGPLDFTGKDLVGILGDTGAGKSTILEAITYALYGSCSWSGEVEPLAAEGATVMSVDLTFAHDNQHWRVRRTFHTNTTPSTHLLENLDTGENVDNRRAVDKKIVSLLKLPLDSFKAAVLLPQGRFDQLLNATGSQRTEVLKGIFGTQAIETMRENAKQHRDRLQELLYQAKLERNKLLDHPTTTAAEAQHAAVQEHNRVVRLTNELTKLRAVQKQAIAARKSRDEITDMLTELEKRRVGEAAEVIGVIEPTEQELAALDAGATADKKTAEERLANATKQLTDAADVGHTTESLATAENLLAAAPDRVSDLAEERDRLEEEQWRLTEENQELDSAATEVRALETTATALLDASESANSSAEKARDDLNDLHNRAGSALGEAVNVARALQEEHDAEQQVQPRRDVLPQRKADVTEAENTLKIANEHLDAIRRSEAAHTAGAGLHAGDVCPVCEHCLPGDYQPPDPIDPDSLASAEDAKAAYAKSLQQAVQALARARADVDSAEDTLRRLQKATQRARARLEVACKEVRTVAAAETWRPSDDIQPLDQSKFAATLDSVTTQLTAGTPEDGEQQRAEMLAKTLDPAQSIEQALSRAAAKVTESAHVAQAKAEAASKHLSSQRNAHERASKKLSEAQRRHAVAEQNLDRDLRSLPAIVQQKLPANRLGATVDQIAEAQRLVTELHSQLRGLVTAREGASDDLRKITERQRMLDRRRTDEITRPLESLVNKLNRWAEAIAEVAGNPIVNHDASLPPVLTDIDTATVSQYTDALARTAATVGRASQNALNDAVIRANELLSELQAQAATAQTGGAGSDAAISLGSGEDLLEAAAFDPLTAAASHARSEERRLRVDQAKAEGQVSLAATLDTAIQAGEARYAATNTLCALLADGKFLRFLTDRRTRALLGLASDLFGQLSGDRFGFAEDFRIVSRSSGATRSPKTLSGGETFLASLALALALVELYSRSGARLGALFLDEGFGSLDVDTLAAALTVLRSETGGDKLVTVISHLHAVAEAVEDVLWIERGPAGSAARWLGTDERDALARQDVSAGLLSLT
jgi:exonuclease SbcC